MPGLQFFEMFRGLTPDLTKALKAYRINAAGDGYELYTPQNGVVGSVTSPLVLTGDVLSLAGLSGFGTSGQALLSTGTGWSYTNTTGTGSVVRAISPALTGTVTAENVDISGNLVFESGAWTITNNDDGELVFTPQSGDPVKFLPAYGSLDGGAGVFPTGIRVGDSLAGGPTFAVQNTGSPFTAIGFFNAAASPVGQQTYAIVGTTLPSVITSLQSVIDALKNYGLLVDP